MLSFLLMLQASGLPSQDPARSALPVDHLIYVTRNLDSAVADLERRLGVRATPGGRHPGRGTHNALIALGSDTYLEILAPDPSQPGIALPPWFGPDGQGPAHLASWAAKGTNLDQLVATATRRGVTMGPIGSGSRRRPDGVLLTWSTTATSAAAGDGLIPFFIDWGSSPHPAASSAAGVRLLSLRAEHPALAPIRQLLDSLGLALPVTPGPRPALIATLDTPKGRVELR